MGSMQRCARGGACSSLPCGLVVLWPWGASLGEFADVCLYRCMPDTTTCSGLLILNWDGTVDLDLGTGWGPLGGGSGARLFL
jgi:hypothetical protein